MERIKKLAIKTGVTLGTLLAAYAVLKLLCVVFGDASFATGLDLQTIIYTAVYTSMISLAMAYNLLSGRFDFSVGATIVLACIIGGNVAKAGGFGPLGLLLSVIAVAVIMGVISGVVYVVLRLPSMITSIGLAMVYEAASMTLYGSKGINMIGKFNVLIFANQKWLWILLAVAVIACVILFEYTRFGYNYAALASGQKIAVDSGLKEKRSTIAVWAISGVLLGVASAIYLSKYGTILPKAGLGSSQYFMGAFLPIFIGGALRKYSNLTIGVVIGAFISSMLASAFVKLGLSSSLQTVMNGVCVLALLIYTSNSYKFAIKRLHRAKIASALETQANPETK